MTWRNIILYVPQGVLPKCLESCQISWERLFCEQSVYSWERLFHEQPVHNWEVLLTLDNFVYLPLIYLLLFAHMCYIPRKRIPGFSLLCVCVSLTFVFWSHCEACEILVPPAGIKPAPPALDV